MDIADSFSQTSKINRFREVEWRRHLSEQGMEEKVICEMKPFLRKVEAFTSYDLPQYLFRVWSETSTGFNCENGEHRFQSQAAKVGLGATDFEIMSEAEISDAAPPLGDWCEEVPIPQPMDLIHLFGHVRTCSCLADGPNGPEAGHVCSDQHVHAQNAGAHVQRVSAHQS